MRRFSERKTVQLLIIYVISGIFVENNLRSCQFCYFFLSLFSACSFLQFVTFVNFNYRMAFPFDSYTQRNVGPIA